MNRFPQFREMSSTDKEEYVKRLLTYMRKRDNILIKGIIDDECILLVSALSDERAHRRLSDKMVVIELLRKCLNYVNNFMADVVERVKNPTRPTLPEAKAKAEHTPTGEPSGTVAERHDKEHATLSEEKAMPLRTPKEARRTQTETETQGTTRHLSDYKHKLSPKLQMQSEALTELYAKLNDAHETRCRLVYKVYEGLKRGEREHASKWTIKHFGAVERKLDITIAAFWHRVDYELMIAEGKERIPEYEKHLADEEKLYPIETTVKDKPIGGYTKKDIDELIRRGETSVKKDGVEVTIEDMIAIRKERNRKYLRRKEIQKTELNQHNLYETARELVEWGELLTETMVANLKAKEVEVPQEWIKKPLTDEEKLAHKRASSRKSMAKIRSERDPYQKVKREIRELEKENPYN